MTLKKKNYFKAEYKYDLYNNIDQYNRVQK